MAIEAPYSKFKKTNLIIYIVACLGFGSWLAYDGYLNKKFIEKHTNDDGTPNSTLNFNRKLPFVLAGGAVLIGGYLVMVSKRKLIADDQALVFGPDDRIPYDSIEKLDKTYFESKGYFEITYRKPDGSALTRKIGSRMYDGIADILDHLVAQLSDETDPPSDQAT